MSWLDHMEDRVNDLLQSLERIADALDRIDDRLADIQAMRERIEQIERGRHERGS